MRSLTELYVPLNRSRQTMTEESEIDETWAHRDFFRAKRIPVLFSIEFICLVDEWCPLNIILLMFD